MPSLPSINRQLWNHLTRGGGLAANLRGADEKADEWINCLSLFLDTKDDFSRFLLGRKSSEMLLQRHNMEYLVTLRDIVTELELMRFTSYTKQTDHTTHTFYLYLLGLWIFDHSNNYRTIYAEQFHRRTSELTSRGLVGEKEMDDFLFQWLFAGLLHDIGYIFENLDNSTLRYRDKLNDLFRLENIQTLKIHFPRCHEKTLIAIRDAILPKFLEWNDKGLMPDFLKPRSPFDIIAELDKGPWLKELFLDGPDSIPLCLSMDFHKAETGQALIPSGEYLRGYASFVAQQGYEPGSPPVVDHAYASGCLLLQLTSIRYWVFQHIHEKDERLEKELGECDPTKGFSYSPTYLLGTVIPACHAAAAHNILPNTYNAHEFLPIDIDNHPLLFLSILCDELQRWHRFPVGSKHLSSPFNFQPTSDSIFYLEETKSFHTGVIYFGCADNEVAGDIRKKLHEKLDRTSLHKILDFAGELRCDHTGDDLIRLLNS